MATAINPTLGSRGISQQTGTFPVTPARQSAVASVREEPSIAFGPIWIWTVVLTTLAMVVGVGLPMWFLTGEIWDGIGLGVFTAVWGGPGFGTMLAGGLWTLRLERH